MARTPSWLTKVRVEAPQCHGLEALDVDLEAPDALLTTGACKLGIEERIEACNAHARLAVHIGGVDKTANAVKGRNQAAITAILSALVKDAHFGLAAGTDCERHKTHARNVDRSDIAIGGVHGDTGA